MNRDGTDIHRVTTIPVAGFHNNGIGFSWSHDGGKLLYSHNSLLYTVDENGANLTLIATAPAGRHFRECEFSYSGDKIVVLTMGEKPYDNEIYTMDANGSNMIMVVDNLPGTINSPTWSIDESQIMYTYDVSGFEDPNGEGRQLDARVFILNLSDTTTTDISVNKLNLTNDTFPRFSPSGSHVIFENTTNDGFNPKNVWRMDVNGDNRTELFNNAETPDWK
jgi:TolB protein